MQPENRDSASLWDMLCYAREVAERVAGRTFEQYQADKDFRLATERRIEIIGEAADRVSKAFREKHAEIPWQKIIAQRHILAHEYDEIIDEKIWKVATIYVPDLVALLVPLVPAPPSS